MKKNLFVFIVLSFLFVLASYIFKKQLIQFAQANLYPYTTSSQIYKQAPMGNGDTNDDGKIDFEDVKNVLEFQSDPTQKQFDQYKDNKINGFDFAVVVSHISSSFYGK